MELFCATCGNLLMARQDIGNAVRYVCQTCPYIYSVDREMSKKVTVARKEVDDVLGGEDTWRTAQRSENSSCPNCGHYESYFFEMQTRSADEPMSIFHKCLKCSSHWKE
ncbi:hypothetical protein BSKO_10982 [Bryopsis sp. KO-2023]|nr:hypothetical protein BSKO_10982 [Bryopsis sp. KO-2023]